MTECRGTTRGESAPRESGPWRVRGTVTLELEALMEVEERPDEDHIVNTFEGGYWGTRTTGVLGYEVTEVEAVDEEG